MNNLSIQLLYFLDPLLGRPTELSENPIKVISSDSEQMFVTNIPGKIHYVGEILIKKQGSM